MPEIRHQMYIKVEPKKVYQTLIHEDEWNAWFTDYTTIDLNHDGTGNIQFRWKSSDDHEIEDGGRIIEAIPFKTFTFQWNPGENNTTVTFQLKPYKEGTLVVLEERGYSNSDKDLTACIGCAVGWGEALTLLKIYLEHGIVYKDDLLLT
ncbi:uncharacterized protein YndB with AHSA1/START domain [Bacillus pakistanensis]|uniref:Uncharacterized protein YndB with AHSA1/START domain n=1 Tax=Rossellomorea pakistanensis TaxID=992288 RepID=A0ABS2NCB0_9BACI|nr:uncharacterized protein YndB with AHSA1/START domain [Bacillus pakistanensis]